MPKRLKKPIRLRRDNAVVRESLILTVMVYLIPISAIYFLGADTLRMKLDRFDMR